MAVNKIEALADYESHLRQHLHYFHDTETQASVEEMEAAHAEYHANHEYRHGELETMKQAVTRMSATFWTHPQLPAEPDETEEEYLERFTHFMYVNDYRNEIRGLE